MVTTSKTLRSASIMAQIPCFSLFLMVSSRDRIAPNCAIPPPSLANRGTAETGEIFRAVGAVLQR